jgi:hypothetical protein
VSVSVAGEQRADDPVGTVTMADDGVSTVARAVQLFVVPPTATGTAALPRPGPGSGLSRPAVAH